MILVHVNTPNVAYFIIMEFLILYISLLWNSQCSKFHYAEIPNILYISLLRNSVIHNVVYFITQEFTMFYISLLRNSQCYVFTQEFTMLYISLLRNSQCCTFLYSGIHNVVYFITLKLRIMTSKSDLCLQGFHWAGGECGPGDLHE